MPGERLKVVVTRRLPDVVEKRLSEVFDVTLRTDDAPMPRDALVAAMNGADVLVDLPCSGARTLLLGLLGLAAAAAVCRPSPVRAALGVVKGEQMKRACDLTNQRISAKRAFKSFVFQSNLRPSREKAVALR